MVKFIIVTGSLVSGLGKGITASSIGLLLKARGLVVSAIKIDPYLNIDSGTLSPYEHGECFTLADGGETDLDLGNYERFLDIELTSNHSITTGKIYNNVLQKERQGDYLGKTVQIIPHITDEIQRLILKAATIPINAKNPDVCIIELGGTIGDIETTPFVEAFRLLAKTECVCFIHVSMIIALSENDTAQKNYKTKPTQHSVAKLREQGINLHILVMRTPDLLNEELKQKLSSYCNVDMENIISNVHVENIYYVPKVFEQQHIVDKIHNVLHLDVGPYPNLTEYNQIIAYYQQCKSFPKYTIAIVGKYTGTQDTYLSLIRAIEHAVFYVGKMQVEINVIDSEFLLNMDDIKKADAVIIAGGFGSRGIEGKLKVAKYCREQKKPLLGICLGLQIMVCDIAKNICGLHAATSEEWTELHQEENDFVICKLPNQTDEKKGGTMRLGNFDCVLKPTCEKVYQIYNQQSLVVERHRHRFEVNTKYLQHLEKGGFKVGGEHQQFGNNNLVEIMELNGPSFYIGCQFHPEFKSRYNRPHPLFIALIHVMRNEQS